VTGPRIVADAARALADAALALPALLRTAPAVGDVVVTG
jgi:hypothetical protein